MAPDLDATVIAVGGFQPVERNGRVGDHTHTRVHTARYSVTSITPQPDVLLRRSIPNSWQCSSAHRQDKQFTTAAFSP